MGSLLIDSYNEFRIQAKRAYDIGDYTLAKELYLKAASVAVDISANASNPSTKAQYERISQQLLEIAKNQCTASAKPQKAQTIAGKSEEKKKNSSHEKKMDAYRKKISFDDIAGLNDVKQMLYAKVIYPLLKPDRAKRYKLDPTKTMQIMLYGPPGTGKTMFADALSTQLNMSLHRAKASELIDPYLGVSSKKLQDFMDEVKEDESERILLFIDEFDAIAQARSNTASGGDAGGEMNRLVNTLLQEVDDLVKCNTSKMIVFLVTTNRPWAIDSAVLRGKRFDTQIYIGLPDEEARMFLIKKYLGIAPKANNVLFEDIVKRLDGYSAADITAICEKITDEPLSRDYMTDKPSEITKADVEKVLSTYRNSITDDMMEDYEKYIRGEKV